MDPKDIAEMTGQAGGDRVKAYKLNEVQMSGDTGKFTVRETIGEKGEDGKYPTKELGSVIKGVILKMRWRLTRYEEGKAGEKGTFWITSEFDWKFKDTVVLFNTGEKGIAADIKSKHGLSTQRVLYVYIPGGNQIVRLIVKASALSADKNPNGEMGLFEYVDSFDMSSGEYLHEYITEFGSVYREDEKNKRKSYFAMTFKRGKGIEPENKAKVVEMIKEVHEKTGTNVAESWEGPSAGAAGEEEDADINPEDIPF